MSKNSSSKPFTKLLLLCFFPLSFSTFQPSDNYLLACGRSSAVLYDGRVFEPDRQSFKLPSSSLSLSSSSSNSSFARVFFHPFSYPFSISSPGLHVLRLHFNPFLNLSSSSFNVSISQFPLLTFFSPAKFTTKEFFLNFNLPILSLSFSPVPPSSFAFVTAIELFSVPDDLISSGGATPVPAFLPTAAAIADDDISAYILETLLRVNVGGPNVTPENDTLWRTWMPDDGFLKDKALAKDVTFLGRIDYPDGGATEETAPESVYGSARAMNKTGNSSYHNFNLSWVLPVSNSNHGYLVRLHFCDIVSKALNELYFNVYINGYSAYSDLDLSSQAGYSLASPYYIDFIVNYNPSRSIEVSIGPSNRSLPSKANAIVNGLEIMKIKGIASFSEPRKKDHTRLVTGLVLGCLFLVIISFLILIVIVFRWKRRQKKLRSQSSSAAASWSPLRGNSYSRLIELTGASPATNLDLCVKIPFSEIILATNNFDDSLQIGSGGFGKVYKGVLRDGTRIAVKRGGGANGSQQGLQEFHSEILVLSKIRHRHLVSLIGYCEEQSEMILVYEFMDRGPLKDSLYGTSNARLSWKQRLEICIGSARGLHYLHTGSAQGVIIHRDVKSSNILLDDNYAAKVADFGLSRSVGACVDQAHVSTGVKGSFGYLDPEYFKTQQLTDKSDVYSFGVVLLEILCARSAIDGSLSWEEVNLAEWGMKWQKKGLLEKIIDPALKGDIDRKSMKKFGETVEKCLAQYGVDRPTMGDVLWNLESALQLHESAMQRESSLKDCSNFETGGSEGNSDSQLVTKDER